MKIKKLEEFNEKRRELFGIDRQPSHVLSRQDQDFYDYYTRGKIRGQSKYELNSKMFELAKRDDEIGTIAQFCLQIERESIANNKHLADRLEELTIEMGAELGEISDEIKQGIEVDDIPVDDIEDLEE